MRLLLPLVAITVSGCGADSLCSSKVLKVARDPTSDRYAVTELRNCGATTDYVTVVRVGRATESQSDAQEVFIADTDHGAASYGGGASIWTNVVWSTSGALSINYASRARVFKSLETANSAKIRYRKTDPFDDPALVP